MKQEQKALEIIWIFTQRPILQRSIVECLEFIASYYRLLILFYARIPFRWEMRLGEKFYSIAIHLDNNDARLVSSKNDLTDSAVYRNTFELAVDEKHVRDFNYIDKRPSD